MARMRVEDRKLLHEALLSVKAGPRSTSGICLHVQSRLWRKGVDGPQCFRINKAMLALMRSWPKYSGLEECPVPHPTLSPDDGYLYTQGRRWDKRTTYGRNRWELLDYLIERTKE